MRKKVQKLVITFPSTTQAMAMEHVCREHNIPGRLIPVPHFLSAGCGLAWCAPPEYRGVLQNILSDAGICCEAVQECLI